MIIKEEKYIVIKNSDIDFLSPDSQKLLFKLLEEIDCCRHDAGKKFNHYVVVNEDEEYSDIIWRLIEMGERLKT